MTFGRTPTQSAFRDKYISTSEIMATLGVTRTTVFAARKAGKLPDAICVDGQLYLWEREKVKPYLDAWLIILQARRASLFQRQNSAKHLMAA